MLYTHVAAGIGGAVLAGLISWTVQDWRWTANTLEEKTQREEVERLAAEARATDARQQRLFNDTAAGRHAATVAGLNTQLGEALGHVATLSGRQCLDAGTVRLLNSIGKPAGDLGLRAAAVEPAGAAQAAAGPGADAAPGGYASERDTAHWIAVCRAQYGEVAGQLNQILDIEERREAGAAAKGAAAMPQPSQSYLQMWSEKAEAWQKRLNDMQVIR